MECFRIDESGYTGFDLLNPEQRMQGAAAVAISDEDAARLIKEHFPTLQAKELKYRALSRRPANHPRILGLLRDLHQGYKCTTYICDKRFLLLLMFADYAIEPFYYERGVDFYQDGQNYALASMLYHVGPPLLGLEEFNRLQHAFQRAVKDKTPGALSDLVNASRETRWQQLPEAIGPIATGSPECLRAIATPGVSTDAAMVVLGALLSRLEEMSSGPYRIEHDQSKNLLRYHDLLQSYIDHDQPAEFRASEIARMKFPLKLASVTQVDSKNSPAVQLADVMIGAALEATNTMIGERSGGLRPEDVIRIYRDAQIIHLLPSIDFDQQKRFRRGTQAGQMIDYAAEHFADKFPGVDRKGK